MESSRLQNALTVTIKDGVIQVPRANKSDPRIVDGFPLFRPRNFLGHADGRKSFRVSFLYLPMFFGGSSWARSSQFCQHQRMIFRQPTTAEHVFTPSVEIL